MVSEAELARRRIENFGKLTEEEISACIGRAFREPDRIEQLRMAEAKVARSKELVAEVWRNKRLGTWKKKPPNITWGDWTLEKLSFRHLQIIHLKMMSYRNSEISKVQNISRSRLTVIFSNSLVKAEMARRNCLSGAYAVSR